MRRRIGRVPVHNNPPASQLSATSTLLVNTARTTAPSRSVTTALPYLSYVSTLKLPVTSTWPRVRPSPIIRVVISPTFRLHVSTFRGRNIGAVQGLYGGFICGILGVNNIPNSLGELGGFTEKNGSG